MKKILILPALLIFASCANKTTTPAEKTEETKQETTENVMQTKTIEGTVVEIQNGKDGYTAKVESADKEINFVTISVSNLKNHEQYKSVKVGDTLKVSGDFWKTETENHITVREIL